MSEFTMREVVAHVESNLCSLTGLTFTARCDVADVIRDALDLNRYEALSVSYNCDAWSVVSGTDFADFDVECDFSECENAIECVALEANEILREAYDQELHNVLTTIAACVEEAFTPGESDFNGASRFYIDEIRQVKSCTLGYVSHSLEYDLTAGDGNAESVCVWLPQRQLYFKVHGMEFMAELLEESAD